MKSTCAIAPALKAFSLIELLMVMAIVGVLSVLTVSGFNAIASAQNTSQGVSEVTNLLERARAEAVARRTFVWAAFRNGTNNGNAELQMALFCSKDGRANPAQAFPLTRTLRAQRMLLTPWDELSFQSRSLVGNPPGLVSLAGSGGNVSFQAGNLTFTNAITFTPQGEALVKPDPGLEDGFDRVIAIGLQNTRGTNSMSAAADAVVVVHGAVGSSVVKRF